MKNRIEILLFNLLLLFVRLIPNRWLPFIGRRFGRLTHFLGVRRAVVHRNLEIAFGSELTQEKRTLLSRRIYENCGIILFEILLLRFLRPDQLSDYIEFENLDILKEAIEEGKGVVLAGNHFGNWELISAAVSTMGYPIYMYAGMQRNRLFDFQLNRIRQRFGTITISKSKTATFEMMKALRANHVLGMAGDLNVPHNKMFVDFFGRQASVGRGLASFTLQRACPLVFIWCVRKEGLRHQGFLTRINYEVTGDRDRDMLSISQAITQHLEERIRQYPDQYFWLNKRWKTRPEDEPDSEGIEY